MLKYIIVLTDTRAPSFCYYDCSKNNSSDKYIMPYPALGKIIEYANKNAIPLYVLYGDRPLEKKSDELLGATPHIGFVHADSLKTGENIIKVFDNRDENIIKGLSASSLRNVIVRIERECIDHIEEIISGLIGKCKRINLYPVNIEEYTDKDIDRYREQLSKIASKIIEEYKKGNSLELNILSDRILLRGMNNCNAGIDHVTFAPNGKFYICPGFYYDDEKDCIGDIEHGIGIENEEMLGIANAPICSVCDAYHCKRCVYLNKKTTMELNTPSYQQCVLSHHERNTAKFVFDTLKRTPGFRDFDGLPQIPEIGYTDPYKVVICEAEKVAYHKTKGIVVQDGEKTITLPPLESVKPGELAHNSNKVYQGQQGKLAQSLKMLSDADLDKIPSKDLLIEIYKMLKLLLREFKK